MKTCEWRSKWTILLLDAYFDNILFLGQPSFDYLTSIMCKFIINDFKSK